MNNKLKLEQLKSKLLELEQLLKQYIRRANILLQTSDLIEYHQIDELINQLCKDIEIKRREYIMLIQQDCKHPLWYLSGVNGFLLECTCVYCQLTKRGTYGDFESPIIDNIEYSYQQIRNMYIQSITTKNISTKNTTDQLIKRLPKY